MKLLRAILGRVFTRKEDIELRRLLEKLGYDADSIMIALKRGYLSEDDVRRLVRDRLLKLNGASNAKEET